MINFSICNRAQVGGKKSIFRYAVNIAFRFDVSFCEELREQSTAYSWEGGVNHMFMYPNNGNVFAMSYAENPVVNTFFRVVVQGA